MVMTRKMGWGALLVLGAVMLLASLYEGAIAQSAAPRATLLSLNGPVTPASASYLEREIAAASNRGDELIVLEIDTPGGLIDSMKSIIKAMLASQTPVATYVSPQGARSASAGLYIMYAAHVSSMAPATNTGSATPIEMGGAPSEQPSPLDPATPEGGEETSEEPAPADISNDASMRGKVIEDSVAYIRSLAELRGRNADWAESAVRPPSASVSATEAVELNVIDFVANDLDDLLAQTNGRTVTTASGEVTINTDRIVVDRVEPSTIEKILGFFANPNVAAILFTLGTTGIIIEMWNPGSIFPGAVGALSLILAFYSFQVLPFNIVPLAIMGLGVVLIVVEMFTPTFGLAGATGLALFTAGLYFLYPQDLRVAPGLLIGTVASGAVIVGSTMWALMRSRGHGPLIGQEAIRKREGRVTEWDNDKGEGYVFVDGERWRAKSKDTLVPDDRIKVLEIDGIVLTVKKVSPPDSKSLNPFAGRQRNTPPAA